MSVERQHGSNNMTERTTPSRPTIDTEPGAVSTAEQFQNKTLRPILKMLDNSLLACWSHHWPKRKIRFDRLSKPDKLAQLERAVREDTKLRLTLVGMVLGHFTPEEWSTFTAEESEITRRLLALLIQRLQSHVHE
ncbi:glyoxalase [Spirosoma sp. 209]|uniref:glyoxalase n=1 Tax=Spirosoma sp. 209 TaxID=1955701 RepID=UPI001F19673C|nr:glyoxalase [Spirosoma sp. 209]